MVKTNNEEIGNLAKPRQGWLTRHQLRCCTFCKGSNHSLQSAPRIWCLV